jgi:membrane-associated phospholipid phosphatase
MNTYFNIFMIRNLAKIISSVLQPIFIPTFGIVMLMLSDPVFEILKPLHKVTIAFCVFLTTGLVPAFIVLLGMATGRVSDGFISKRTERTWPYLISLLGYLGGCYWLYYISVPMFYIIPLIGSAISLTLIALINFAWKISAHATAMGGLAGGIVAYSFLFGINPVGLICTVIMLSGLVCSARMILKAHTFGQVSCGWSLGFIAVAATWIVFAEIMTA